MKYLATSLLLVSTAAVAQTPAVDYICAVVISPPGTGGNRTQSPLTCITPAKLAAVLVAAAPTLFSGAQGPAGPQGPSGPQGVTGPAGQNAVAGAPTVTCPDPTTPCLVGVMTDATGNKTYIPVIAGGTVQLASMQSAAPLVGMIADEPASALNVAPPTAPGDCPPSNIADPNYTIWATDASWLYVGLRTASGGCQWGRVAIASVW